MYYEIDVYTHTRGGAAPRSPTAVADLPEGEKMILLVGGADSHWGGSHQPVMDLLKEAFPAELARTAGPMQERLIQAAAAVDEAFCWTFPEVRSLSEYDDDVFYSATFLAAVIERKRLWTAWIGPKQAKLFRQGRCVAATAAHAFMAAEADPYLRRRTSMPTRYIHSSPNQPPAEVETGEPWPLQIGDALVVAEAETFVFATDEKIGGIVCGAGSHPAVDVVRCAEEVQDAFVRSAIVVRVRGGATPGKQVI